MTNSLLVSFVLWGKHAPTHRISSVFVSPDFELIVTGCRDGQLCTWTISEGKVTATAMLFGHSSCVSSITAIGSTVLNNNWKPYVVSASDDGQLYLWDLIDGRCLEQSVLPGCPSSIQGHNFYVGNEVQQCIMCCGNFNEILILSSSTLSVLLTLQSRVYPDWICCASVISEDESQLTKVIALTLGGMIKVWSVSKSKTVQPYLCEEESKQISYTTAVSLQVSKQNPSLLLIISSHMWQVCDSLDYSVLCCGPCDGGEQWMGGDFMSSNIIALWTRKGKVVTFQLPFTSISQESYRSSLKTDPNLVPKALAQTNILPSQQTVLPPAITMFQDTANDSVFLIIGDCNGVLSVTSVSSINQCSLLMQSSLSKLWNSLDYSPVGVLDQLSHNDDQHTKITATLYILQYFYLCCGRDDGSIIVVSAAKTCKAHLLKSDHFNRKGWPPHRTLRGHKGKVTCLLYPHQDTTDRFGSEILVSGSADFSVNIWDIFVGTLLHSFQVHAGEICQLILPPKGCSQRVLQSVCSVAKDNSVALLHVRDRKCVLLASCHSSTVEAVRWRPHDDFLLVSCADGSLFVWQIETGQLDRYEHGAIAQEIVSACDEIYNYGMDMVTIQKQQHSVGLSQAIKHGNLSAFKTFAKEGLKSIIDNIESDSNSVDSVSKVSQFDLLNNAFAMHFYGGGRMH